MKKTLTILLLSVCFLCEGQIDDPEKRYPYLAKRDTLQTDGNDRINIGGQMIPFGNRYIIFGESGYVTDSAILEMIANIPKLKYDTVSVIMLIGDTSNTYRGFGYPDIKTYHPSVYWIFGYKVLLVTHRSEMVQDYSCTCWRQKDWDEYSFVSYINKDKNRLPVNTVVWMSKENQQAYGITSGYQSLIIGSSPYQTETLHLNEEGQRRVGQTIDSLLKQPIPKD